MRKIKKKGKKVIRKLILLLVYVIILFVLFEFSLRLFYPQPVFKHTVVEASPQIFKESSYLPAQLKPSTKTEHLSVTDEFNVSININSLGYRDYEFTTNKPEDTYRILAIGDSVTYGFGVEIDETYVKVLEKLLNEKGYRKYSVINAGWNSGDGLDTEYLFLKREGLSLNPDMIIVGFFMENDFREHRAHIWESDKYGEIDKIKSKKYYIDSNNRLRSIGNGAKSGIKEQLYKTNVLLSFHSHLYILFKNSFRNTLTVLYSGRPAPGIYSLGYSELVKQDIETTLDLILRMKNIAYENNISLVLVILPTREQVYDYKIKDSENNLLNWTKPNDILKEFGIKNDIMIIDILPKLRDYIKFNDTKIYFKIDPHWNKNGNYIVGKALYKELKNKKII